MTKTYNLESDLQSDIIDYAHVRGWFCQKVAFVGRRGCMDVLAIRHGRHVFIEVKKPGEEPTLQQSKVAREMRSAGADVYAVDSIEQARAILR